MYYWGCDCCSYDEWTHGLSGDCFWRDAGHPELCSECLRGMGINTSSSDIYGCLCCMGIPDNYKSVEVQKEVGMVSSILGTVWFCLVCVMVGFMSGVYLYPWVKDRLSR